MNVHHETFKKKKHDDRFNILIIFHVSLSMECKYVFNNYNFLSLIYTMFDEVL